MRFYKEVNNGDFLLSSSGVLSFSTEGDISELEMMSGRKRSRRLWVSPESTQVYLITQDAFDEALDVEGLCAQLGFSQETHRVSFHRIDEWLCAVVIEMEAWNHLLEHARTLIPYIGSSKIYFLDIWMIQQAMSNTSSETVLHLPGSTYTYRMVDGVPDRLFEKNNNEANRLHVQESMPPVLNACYASDINHSKCFPGLVCHMAKWLLMSIIVFMLGVVVMLGVNRYQLNAMRGPYRALLQSYATEHEGVLGHLNEGKQWSLSTYFDRVMDPLGEVVHSKSHLNQMIFNPLTDSVLMMGTISESSELTQWMKLKKHPVYKKLQVSMVPVPHRRQLNDLDRAFIRQTDADYDDVSLLVLQMPNILPDFHYKTIARALAYVSADGGEG